MLSRLHLVSCGYVAQHSLSSSHDKSAVPVVLCASGDAAPGEHVAIYIGENADGVGMTIGQGGSGLGGEYLEKQ